MRTARLMRLGSFGIAISLSITMTGFMFLLSNIDTSPRVIFWLCTGSLLVTYAFLLKGLTQGMVQAFESNPIQDQPVARSSNPRLRFHWLLITFSIPLGLAIWTVILFSRNATDNAYFLLTITTAASLIARTVVSRLYPNSLNSGKAIATDAATRKRFTKIAAQSYTLPFVMSLCVIAGMHFWMVTHSLWILVVALGVAACCIPLQLAVIRSVARELGVAER